MKNAKENIKFEKTNPGTVLLLNEKCKRVFPTFFDGLIVSVNRNVGTNFKIFHSTQFGSISSRNCKFGATYIGNEAIQKHEEPPAVYGNIDVSGNGKVTLNHLFRSRCKLKYTANTSGTDIVANQLEAHYFADTFTLSAVMTNADLFNRSGCLSIQYLQNVSSKFDIGLELDVFKNLEHFKGSVVESKDVHFQPSIVGRYRTLESSLSAVVGVSNLVLSYYLQASHQVECGVELNSNFRSGESVSTFATKVNLSGKEEIFKTLIDSNTNIGAVFEKKIRDSPLAIAFSGNLNFRTSIIKLGFGISVE